MLEMSIPGIILNTNAPTPANKDREGGARELILLLHVALDDHVSDGRSWRFISYSVIRSVERGCCSQHVNCFSCIGLAENIRKEKWSRALVAIATLNGGM